MHKALLLAVAALFIYSAAGPAISLADEDMGLTDREFLAALNESGLADIGFRQKATIVDRTEDEPGFDTDIVYYGLGSSCVSVEAEISAATRKILSLRVQGDHGDDACEDRIDDHLITLVALKVLQIVSGINDPKEIGDALATLR